MTSVVSAPLQGDGQLRIQYNEHATKAQNGNLNLGRTFKFRTKQPNKNMTFASRFFKH